MRNELADLLGQPVVLEGRLNRCEPNAIGSLNICLKAVDVHPWRTDAAICSLNPVRVDHGWLQMARPQHLACPDVQIYWMTAVVELGTYFCFCSRFCSICCGWGRTNAVGNCL